MADLIAVCDATVMEPVGVAILAILTATLGFELYFLGRKWLGRGMRGR